MEQTTQSVIDALRAAARKARADMNGSAREAEILDRAADLYNRWSPQLEDSRVHPTHETYNDYV